MIRYKCSKCGRIYVGWSKVMVCEFCKGDLYEEKNCCGQEQEGK